MATVQIDGDNLYCKEAGSGPPILLIHGTGIDADSWGATFDLLAQDHRVVAYDRRGHTRSRGAGASRDWIRHEADAIAVMEQLELGPSTVVGWSAGGIVAIRVALSRPDLVNALVLAEAVITPPTPAFGWSVTRMQLRKRRPVEAYDGWMRHVCTRGDLPNTWEDPDYPEERRQVARQNAPTVLVEAEVRALKNRPGPKHLARVACPVTLIVGEFSNPYFLRNHKLLKKARPDAREVVIPRANHALSFCDAEAYAEAIVSAVPAAVLRT